MRFTRLSKAIESGLSIENNGTPSQVGPDKTKEASKKRKRTMRKSDDSDKDQIIQFGDGQAASRAGNLGDDFDGENIALVGQLGNAPAPRKATNLSKTVLTSKDKRTNDSNLAVPEVKCPMALQSEILSLGTEETSRDANLTSLT